MTTVKKADWHATIKEIGTATQGPAQHPTKLKKRERFSDHVTKINRSKCAVENLTT